MSTKGKSLKRYSSELKLEVLRKKREHHLSICQTAKENNITASMVRDWGKIYLTDGAKGFVKKRKKPKHNSPQFKVGVVEDIKTNNLSYRKAG